MECGETFDMANTEIRFYKEQGFKSPCFCVLCREERRREVLMRHKRGERMRRNEEAKRRAEWIEGKADHGETVNKKNRKED